MREEYLAEEMNERDDLFEDIPDDELEEVEREARELRSWFENPDMWAGKSVHDYMEDGWSEDHWYEEDEDMGKAYLHLAEPAAMILPEASLNQMIPILRKRRRNWIRAGIHTG